MRDQTINFMPIGRRRAAVSLAMSAFATFSAVASFTFCNTASAADRTWTGIGPAGAFTIQALRWGNVDNWDVPASGSALGDKLIFPAGAPRRTNTNSFPDNTVFSGIEFSGTGCASGTNCDYVLNGNEINLSGGNIRATVAAGTMPIVNLPITLASPNTIFNALANSSPLTFNGSVNLNGHPLTVAPVLGAAVLINGDLTGTGVLRLANRGRLTLTGTAPATVAASVTSGTLVADGTGSTPVTLSGDVTLRGSGQVGPIAVSGSGDKNITPGSGDGNTGTGQLLVKGSATLSSSTTLNIALNGTTAVSGYSVLKVIGTTTLNGATLAVTLGFVPTVGQMFNILPGLVGSVEGTFAQGTSITANGVPFSITYNATSVVLTVLPKIWTGAGADSNWTTAANWVGNVAPSAGSDLVFPESAARKTHTNNFPSGTSFKSIALNGTAYAISGNAIVLTGGITANHASGVTPKLLFDVTLGAPQTFSAGVNGFETIGTLKLNGFTLTADAPSGQTALMQGSIIGAGGLDKTGPGALILSGNNTYTGVTQILAGNIFISDVNALGAIGAGNHTIVSTGAQLTVFTSGGVIGEALTLSGDGTANNGALGLAFTTADHTLGGAITLAADASISLNSSRYTVTAPIDESGGARKLTVFSSGSPGTLVLQAANTYAGGTLVAGLSTLEVNGSAGAVSLGGASPLSPSPSGRLSGSGSVGALTVAATGNSNRVRPGDGSSGGPGILTVVGNVVLTPQTTYEAGIGGTTVGSQYDQIKAGGTVALGGAALLVSHLSGFVPVVGDSFTLIQSAGPISGQFAQGNSVTVGSVVHGIIYNANSVALTVLPPAQVLTVTPRGSGSGTVLSTPVGISCGVSCSASLASGMTVTLTATPVAGSVFTGWLGACTGRANCVLTIGSNNTVSASFALSSVVTSNRILDIDANNAYDGLTDGQLVMRFLQGRAGAALTTGVLGPSPGRSDPTNYLSDVLPYLDADGNGAVDALTDGLLVIRHLLGFTGSALTQNALGAGARRDADQIKTYLNGLKP